MSQKNQNPKDVFTGNKSLLETAQGKALVLQMIGQVSTQH